MSQNEAAIDAMPLQGWVASLGAAPRTSDVSPIWAESDETMYSISSLEAELPFAGFEQDRISGECEMSDQRLVDEVDIAFGVWQVTPGSFRSHWPSWEAFTVLTGAGTLEDEKGTVHQLIPGALVVIPAGSTGVWNITETLRKTYMFAVTGGGLPGIPEGFLDRAEG